MGIGRFWSKVKVCEFILKPLPPFNRHNKRRKTRLFPRDVLGARGGSTFFGQRGALPRGLVRLRHRFADLGRAGAWLGGGGPDLADDVGRALPALARCRHVGIDGFPRVCTMHTMTRDELIRRMKKADWVLRGSKGSHHIFIHPQRPGHVSVPHPKKDLGVDLLDKLMKQTGLK